MITRSRPLTTWKDGKCWVAMPDLVAVQVRVSVLESALSAVLKDIDLHGYILTAEVDTEARVALAGDE